MIDNNIIVTGLIGILATVVSSVIAWFTSRKKYRVEVSHDEIVNMRDSLEFYKELTESNNKTLKTILTKSEELASSNIQLLIEVQNLKAQISILLQVINVELGDVDLSKYGIKIENGTLSRKKVSK